ncbi:MAG: autotransporter-associated beta strand repeat-containing protein [Chthoniobacter sp.]|nr:autotransporter-associated beta strand repeat-containing protein [Chthoniobacter sp.]
MKTTAIKTSTLPRSFLADSIAALLALTLGSGSALAFTDGTWILNGDALWSNNTTAWSGNAIADGAGATATFDTVTFTASRSITLDTNRTIGILKLGNGGGNRNLNLIGSTILTLDGNGSNAQITFKSGGQNSSIAVPVELKSNLLITNSDAGGNKGFFFSNGLSSTNGDLTITNTSNANSRTKFNSTVSDGTGTLTFNQTNGWAEFNNANTFTGSTTNGGGTLILGNSLALQNSALDTANSVTGSASVGLRITGTAATALTLGGLTGNKNLAATGGVFNTTTNGYATLAALTLNPGTGKSYSYSGGIANGAANMTLTKTGSGMQTLTGTNTYTGATAVNVGTLAIGGSGSINTSSGISVAAGSALVYNSSTALSVAPTLNGAGILNRAVLGGTGPIAAALTLDNLGDTLSAGNSPGVQSFTVGQTWNSFTDVWQVNDFTGTVAGTAFDQISIGGGLTLSGGSGNYSLNLQSLTGLNVGGNVPNFSETDRSWTIVTTTGGITGFDAANWTIDATGFADVTTGTWSLATANSNNDLVLSYTTVPEPGTAILGAVGMLTLLRRRRRS